MTTSPAPIQPIEAPPVDPIEHCHATRVLIVQRSGVLVDVEFTGLLLRLSSGFCQHANISVALYYTGREPSDSLSALVVCPICGVINSSATLLYIAPPPRTLRAQAIFADAERHMRSQHRRAAWGLCPARY